MLRVAAFTGGKTVSSARFRVRQHIGPLAELGISVDEYAASLGSFPPSNPFLRPAWAVGAILTRLAAVASSHRYDLTLLQREMVSTFRTLEPLTKSPRVLDLDDAVWLHRRGHNLKKIAERCDAVICGNDFIAEWARKNNSDVNVLPTGVDTARFVPWDGRRNETGQVVIGWMGQSSGYIYLHAVREAIRYLTGKYGHVKFRMISDASPPAGMLPHRGAEFARWSAEAEAGMLQEFDIGIMPLDSSPWCLGKCSYKMLLYMACGVPVVVSDCGMNTEILKRAAVGYGVRNTDEWIQALECLIHNPALRSRMGQAGRRVVEERYSLRVLTPQLARILGVVPARRCQAMGKVV